MAARGTRALLLCGNTEIRGGLEDFEETRFSYYCDPGWDDDGFDDFGENESERILASNERDRRITAEELQDEFEGSCYEDGDYPYEEPTPVYDPRLDDYYWRHARVETIPLAHITDIMAD
ncbi:MAG TPA: hypothetical protein VJB98_00335 [Candidatus Paceibacterota bacterium]